MASSNGWPGQTKAASGLPGTALRSFSKAMRSYLARIGSPVPIWRSREQVGAGMAVIS
jgi:hypothetical protein